MDKQVSVTSILNGIDYLKNDFSSKMDSETEQVQQAYDSMTNDGLSSAEINSIVSDIKTKILKLKDDFTAVEEGIRKDFNVSAETIREATTNIKNTLGGK